MLASRPAVVEDISVVATGFFQGIGQHRQVSKVSTLVPLPDPRRQQVAVPSQPGGGERWIGTVESEVITPPAINA
jgi:hypothetical protein